MEELAKALAEAVRAGNAIAPTALVGYYLVRGIEALAGPLGFISVASIASYTIRTCVLRYADIEEKTAKTIDDKIAQSY